MNDGVKHVIWLQTGFLGDIILSTGAMKLLKDLRPDIEQIVITTPVGVQLLQKQSWLNNVLTFDKRHRSLLGSVLDLRRRLGELGVSSKSTVLLQPHLSYRSSFLALGLGLKRITFVEAACSFLAKFRVPRVAVFHEAQRVALLLEPLGLTREQVLGARPYLQSLGGSAPEAYQTFRQQHQKIWAVAPGSVWGTKRWPADRFRELVSKMLDDAELAIVLMGAKEDESVANEVIGQNHNRILNLVGKTSIAQLHDVYSSVDGLVANDSAPIHFASAFDRPTLAIFGATVPGLGFGPLSAKRKIVEHPALACRPCSDHGPQVCPLGHFKCMNEISVDTVYRAFLELN